MLQYTTQNSCLYIHPVVFNQYQNLRNFVQPTSPSILPIHQYSSTSRTRPSLKRQLFKT